MSEMLIYAMSSKGCLKLDQYNQLFRAVYLPSVSEGEDVMDIDVRYHVIRVLDSLGYCEFNFNNRMVYMCEPSLVLLPVFGVPKALLTGARSPSLVEKLKAVVKTFHQKALVMHLSQENMNISMPACICIEAVDVETIREIGRLANITCYFERPAAWDLVNSSSSFDDISVSLKFEVRTELNWKRRIFSENFLAFLGGIERQKEGYSLVEYRNPIDQQLRHWLWNGGSACEVGRDWGRYMALGSRGINVLMYDKRLQKLAVPATVPLPCILARAVAMCSGITPVTVTAGKRDSSIPEGHSVHLYSGVPVFIADAVAAKLKQKIFYTSFGVDRTGMLNA